MYNLYELHLSQKEKLSVGELKGPWVSTTDHQLQFALLFETLQL